MYPILSSAAITAAFDFVVLSSISPSVCSYRFAINSTLEDNAFSTCSTSSQISVSNFSIHLRSNSRCLISSMDSSLYFVSTLSSSAFRASFSSLSTVSFSADFPHKLSVLRIHLDRFPVQLQILLLFSVQLSALPCQKYHFYCEGQTSLP